MMEELFCECGNHSFKISKTGTYFVCDKCFNGYQLIELQKIFNIKHFGSEEMPEYEREVDK